MKLFMLPLFVLCLFLIAACNENSTKPSTEQIEIKGDFFPLALGNRWDYRNYEVFVHDSTQDTVFHDNFYNIVDSAMYRNGNNWYRFVQCTVDFNYIVWVYKSNDGIWRVPNDNYTELYMKYPIFLYEKIKVSDVYNFYTGDIIGSSYNDIIGNNIQVTVDAGTFNCIQMKRYDVYFDKNKRDDIVTYEYFADKVGPVLIEVCFYDDEDDIADVIYKAELTSYNLK